jgi:hypothetical protein
MNWTFQKYSRGEKIRNPIIGEFFSTQALENPAEPIIREGIQNAIDATCNLETTRVRIYLDTGDQAPDTSTLSRWFEGIWQHIETSKNGNREIPDQNSKCPFLLFEDFGTTGLIGDINQAFEDEEINNPFFYFFRAEGLSGKRGNDLGRWGVGKHVFPRSSRISTYFGYSKRYDDGVGVLMGCSILKSHKVNGIHYKPDGYLGIKEKNGDLILPFSERETLEKFEKDFNISKRTQPGLSIVVPYIDPEITIDHIREAVILGYFYPILRDSLVVEIETPDKKIILDSSTLLSECGNLDDKSNKELMSLIELARWATSEKTNDVFCLKNITLEHPIWTDDLIPEKDLEKIKANFDQGKFLALQVGLQIQEKGDSPIFTFFDVYLVQDGFDSGHPVFIREGIIISDIHSPRSRGVRSLVVVSDKPLATLLGDSENPAHTQWQKDSSNFKNKYVKGKNIIDFVTKFVSNFVNALCAKENEEDVSLLVDIFAIPKQGEEVEKIKPSITSTTREGKVSGGGPGPLDKKEESFQISQMEGGFRIIPIDSDAEIKTDLDVWMAYDTPIGNPITKYHPFDFDINKPPLNYLDASYGVTILLAELNHIQVRIIDKDYRLEVSGFDKKRDLFVKVSISEEDND